MGQEETAVINNPNDPIELENDKRKYLIEEEKQNVFVIAGAGAGKSTSLVQRIYHQLISGINPENIYAITFTNKATEELRAKILKHLIKTNKDGKNDNLIKNVNKIHISTIHKFCEDILKENAILQGLSPRFAPILDLDEKDLRAKVISVFFKNFKGWDDFSDFGSIKSNKDVKEDIITAFNSFLGPSIRIKYEQIYKADSLKISHSLPKYNSLVESYLAKVNEYIETFEQYKIEPNFIIRKPVFDNGYIVSPNPVEEEAMIEKYKGLSLSTWKTLTCPFDKKKFQSLIKAHDTGYVYEDELARCASLVESLIRAKRESIIEYERICIKHAYDLYLQYLASRDADPDFVTSNDLVYKAYDLLTNHPKRNEVIKKLQAKMKYLYIDEYQDTDSVQYQIAKIIRGDDKEKLYLVGDPKQSIYRFRGAEPDVYFETMKEFTPSKSGIVYELDINFRSNSKILDWVNEKYDDNGGFKLTNVDSATYRPMLYPSYNKISDAEYEDDNNLIGFYRFDKKDPNNPKEIADLIHYLVNNKKIRKDISSDENKKIFEYQKVEYKDIMVLLPNHSKMPPYAEIFTQENIPTQIYGESRFDNSIALRAFVSLFNALYSRNTTSITLASSTFAILYKDLYEGKTVEENNLLSERLLNSLYNDTEGMDGYGKSIYLVEHLNLLFKENEIYEDYQIEFAVSKLYQLVETTFSKGNFNGKELADEYRNFLSTYVERESLIMDDPNAVLLINLHKAKGLEKPIVIYVSPSNRDQGSDISFAFKNGIFYPQNIINQAIELDETRGEVSMLEQDEDYEQRRLEYVAATRPQEAFIFALHEKNVGLFKEKNYDYKLSELRPIVLNNEEDEEDDMDLASFLGLDGEGDSITSDKVVVEEEPSSTKEIDNNFKDESVEILPHNHDHYVKGNNKIKIVSPSRKEKGYSEIREEAAKIYKESHNGELPITSRPKSDEVGNVMHRTFELMIKDKLSIDNAVEIALKESQIDDNGVSEKFIKACAKELEKYLAANYQDYDKYSEFGYSYEVDNEIHNGYMDLLLNKGNKYIIIDFKSDEAEYIEDDEIFKQTLKEKYEWQLYHYFKVIQNLFPHSSIDKYIIFFRRYDEENGTVELLTYKN